MSATQARKHYVYVHIRNDTDEVFYVGQGIGDRAWDKTGRNRWWRHIVEKHGYTPWVIESGITKQVADKLEIDLIAEYGRADLGEGNLVNLTDGGDGCLGRAVTDEEREAKRQQMIGNKHSLGRVMPDWEKVNRSAANLGQKRTEETKQALAAAKVGSSNPNFNSDIYKWVHRDGRELHCTTNEMAKLLELRSCKTSRVANKNDAKSRSIYGWFIGKVQDADIKKKHLATRPRGESHGNFDPTLRTFQHEDGRVVTATTYDMRNKYGCNFGISSVVTGERYSHHGWRLEGSEPYQREITWTREACIESAAAFPTKIAWQSSCGGAYNAALANDWLDQCCGHMICGHAARAKNVVNLDTREVFLTAKAAADCYEIDPSSISKVCRRGRGTSGGYRWAFEEGAETIAKEG